jgi:hypothetical protein
MDTFAAPEVAIQAEAEYQRITGTRSRGRRLWGLTGCLMKGLSQAIPPAYTEYIGRQLL